MSSERRTRLFGRRRVPLLRTLCALMLAACQSNPAADSTADAGHAHGNHSHDHDAGHAGPVRDDGGFFENDGGAGDLLRIPPGFPMPRVPPDNPLSAAKIELGRRLFYDVRMSANQTQSCASCHEQAKAFTDGKARGVGSTGQVHPRGSMSLANLGYLSVLTWGNPLMDTLERQILAPMFGTDPVELGLVNEAMIIDRLRAVDLYEKAFREAYPEDAEPITLKNLVRAVTSFERTLISGRSAYDRWLHGEDAALSQSAQRGFQIFNGHPFECFHCHSGFNFTDSVAYQGSDAGAPRFHNTGLYNLDGKGAYPSSSQGVYELSMMDDDMGRFRAPTLRNIAVTAPYMHDGSIATLSDVLDHYAAGGRTITKGPYAGVGATSPVKSNLVPGFTMTEQERADVIAFLESLTDSVFLTDPRFSDPWQPGSGAKSYRGP